MSTDITLLAILTHNTIWFLFNNFSEGWRRPSNNLLSYGLKDYSVSLNLSVANTNTTWLDLKKENRRRSFKCLRTLLIVVVIMGLTPVNVKAAVTNSDENNVKHAVNYLRTVAYNPDLRMCREAPRIAPDVYWVASDNLLAYKALEPFDFELASTIRSRLMEISRTYSLPSSSDGLPLSLRYDVIIRDDEKLEIPPRDMTHITLYNDSYVLRSDIANGTALLDWEKYADLLLLAALSNHIIGEDDNAIGNLTSAIKMWDGVGLRDTVYESEQVYVTYKLGLLLYVSSKLGVNLGCQKDIIKRIWSMQDKTTGGIYTHILPDGTPGDSDTNTETTALTILGITSIQSQPLDWIMPTVTIIAVAITALIIIIYGKKRRQIPTI